MNFDKFKQEIFELADKIGFDEYELYYQTSSSTGLDVFQGKIDEFKKTINGGVSFRGILNGKSALTFSEVIDEKTAQYLVDNAYQIVQHIEYDDEEEIILHDGSGKYNNELELYFPEIDEIDLQDKINFILELEKKGSELTDIDRVVGTKYSDSKVYARIANSKGLDIDETQNYIYTYIGLSKSDGKDNYVEYEDKIAYSYEELKDNNIVEKARENLLKKMNSTSIKTGNYKCIFRYDAASDLLNVFSSAFNAKACQKGYSPYNEKIGKKIASNIINIIDDPTMPKGLASSKFDGEGVATFKKIIVSEGVLQTHLHNLSTAKKAGINTTGNASRGGFKSDVGISPTNFYIQNGDLSFDNLLEEMGEGIVITYMEGMHSATDTISGDFSLGAKGFYYKDGKLSPIHQIVITDNYYDILKRIVNIANDLDLNISSIASPSFLINSISVAGQEHEGDENK